MGKDTIELTVKRFGNAVYISDPEISGVEIQQFIKEDYLTQKMIVGIKAAVLCDEIEKVEANYPADWWQAFKARWFPEFLRRWFPVRFVYVRLSATVYFPNFIRDKKYPKFLGTPTLKIKMRMD